MNKIIIIIICVLAVGVGFFVYTAKNQNKPDQTDVNQILTPEEKELVIDSLSAPATSTKDKKVDTKILESLSAPATTTKSTPSLSDEEQRKILESLQAK